MAKKKSYSAEAIIERDYQEQLQKFEKPLEAKEPPTTVPLPTDVQLSGTQPLAMRNYTISRSRIENAPKPLPFMAKAITEDGRPLYGTGFHGWMRKLWADISDPAKLLQDTQKLSDEESDAIWSEYNERVEETGKILEGKLRWSEWGQKIFGITAEEVGALTAGGKFERETTEALGESQLGTTIARTVAIARDTTQNVIWGGLDILGLDDTLMRKIHTTLLGVDAVADRFNEDEVGNTFVEKLYQLNPVAVGKDLYTIGANIIKGELTIEETGKTIKQYQAGSAMAYTMLFDNYRKEEYERRVAAGEEEYVVAQELGILSTEITGSILGSPSTLLGLNVKAPINIFTKAGQASMPVATFLGRNIELGEYALKVPWRTVFRIPSFGEIFALNVSKTRIANEALRYTQSAIPELEIAIKNIDNATGEQQAMKILEESAMIYSNKLSDMSKHKQWWNLSTLDSNGKVAITARDSSMFIQALVSREGIDTSIQILRDMVATKRGGLEAVEAGARVLSRNNANLLTSDPALMSAEIINRLDNDRIFDTIQKFGDNPAKLHEAIFNKLESALHDFIPSVDEMFDARKAVTDIGKNIPTDPSELAKYTKNQQLSKMLDELPQVVKTVNRLTRTSEFVTKKTTAAMAYTFMNLVPRSWTRNVMGQFWGIATQQGMKNALETTLSAFVGFSKKRTVDMLESTNARIAERLGYIPAQSARKIGSFAEQTNKGIFSFGVMPALGRTEEITSQQVMLTAVNDHILKSLPATVKNLPEWDNLVNSLPKEQQPLLYYALERTYGNFDQAVDLFRKTVGNGEIEAWRLTRPSDPMIKELERWGMMDAFYDIQRNAQTPDEFNKFIEDFITKYTDEVTKNAENMPSTLSSLPTELSDWGMDMSKNAPEKMRDITRELIQGWQNTLGKLEENAQSVVRNAERQVNGIPDPTLRQTTFLALDALKQDINKYRGLPRTAYAEMNEVRSQVVNLIKGLDKLEHKELEFVFSTFKVTYKGRESFNLAKIYPDINLASLSTQQAKSLIWEAMFEATSSTYKNTNLGAYNQIMDKLNEVAGLFGNTLDNVASGGNAFRELDDLRNITLKIEDAFAWQRLFRTVNFNPDLDLSKPVSTLVDDFKKTHPDWVGSPVFFAKASKQYPDMNIAEAMSAFNKSKRVPPYDGGFVTEPRSMWEGLAKFTQDIRDWGTKVTDDWGVKVKTLPTNIESALPSLKRAFNNRMDVVKATAGVVAESTRNFILHDYQRTYLDHAITYLLGNSFHYWTGRTYMRAIETVLQDPKIANVYMQYKEWNEKKHSDLPPFYRQNLQINNILGIDMKNPLFINLEAAINPIYGLTGTDFNDPRKRVDWISRTIDDMSKFGATFSPLVSWAIAMHLYNMSEQDAAARWTNRLLPQSQLIKSSTAMLDNVLQKINPNIDLSPLETDPFTTFLDGGVDPYERNRVAAALAIMVRDGTITSEQMIEASRLKEGDIWNAGIELAAEKRFQGDFTSFFFGAAIRPRTEDDMVIEKFWNDYGALIASRDMMTPEEYRQAWDNLRDNKEYGEFADALLVSRKAGAEQDTAYAYNVFGRIPPGQLTATAEAVGINPEMIEAFYDNKGDFSEMGLTAQDQQRFMAGIADIGAILALPSNPTREGWNEARDRYEDMNQVLQNNFGDDILEKINAMYDADNSDDYLELHPEVQAALDFQTTYILQDPILDSYYGGIDEIGKYYRNSTRNVLLKEFGEETLALAEEYSDPRTSVERSKELKRLLKGYLQRKSQLTKENEAVINQFALLLPDPPRPKAQDNITPQGESQTNLFNLTQPRRTPQEWEQMVGTPTMELLMEFATGDLDDIPYAVMRNLDFIADREGFFNGDELVNEILSSLPVSTP